MKNIYPLLLLMLLSSSTGAKPRNFDIELNSTFGVSRHRISESLGISKFGFGTDIDAMIHKNFKGFGIGAGIGYNMTQFRNLRFDNTGSTPVSLLVRENYHHLSFPIDFVYKYHNKSVIYPYVQAGFDNIINLTYNSDNDLCDDPACQVKRDLQPYSLAMHTGVGMGIDATEKLFLQFGFKYLVFLTNNIFEDINDKSFRERPYILGVNLSFGYKFR